MTGMYGDVVFEILRNCYSEKWIVMKRQKRTDDKNPSFFLRYFISVVMTTYKGAFCSYNRTSKRRKRDSG